MPLESEESFFVKSFEEPYFYTPWHYHREYEIVLIVQSSGKKFIGDSVSDFKEGDIALLGPNLPHVYRNERELLDNPAHLKAKSIVVHFLEISFGEGFLDLPEAEKIRTLLNRSRHGLEIKGSANEQVRLLLHQMLGLNGLTRWMKLVEVLQIISESEELQPISETFMVGKNNAESERMNKIFEFVLKNFQREITVPEIADHVNLAPNSFSRYFSNRTRKPFIHFVNEVRLSHAAKLLQENRLSVAEICYESGFNNLSHFNRQFRNKYGKGPLGFKKDFIF